jgi:protein-disulfide isomerase
VAARKLADGTVADDKKWSITGTPSFAINGTMLTGTLSWDVLQPQIDARL